MSEALEETPSDDILAEEIYHLRRSGFSFQDIKGKLIERWGLSYDIRKIAGIYNEFRVSLAEAYGDDERKALMFLELERLDALQAAYWQNAMNGDVASGKFVLDLMKNRQSLTGLDTINAAERNQILSVFIAGQDRDAFLESLNHGRQLPSAAKVIEVGGELREDGEVTEERA